MVPDLSSTSLPWYQRVRQSRPEGSATSECIDAAFARQAGRTPDRAILVDESRYLTCGELSSRIEARAAALQQRARGRPQQQGVGVLLENDAEKVVTYFACLKAGLPYVPLDTHSPAIQEQVLARAPLGVLVTSRRFAPVLAASLPEDLPGIWIGEEAAPESATEPFPEPDPLRIAHLAFTSGTGTGVPGMAATDHVGSMLSHAWRSRLWPFDPARDVVGCNIFGIWDVVPALCRGVPAVLIRDGTMRDPFALASAIVRFGITRIMMTPTLLGACLDCAEGIEALRRLRLLVLCGETAAPAIVQRAWEALPGVRIANLYSTAECHDIAGGELMPGKAVTCGVIADFAEVHLCDPDDPHRLVEVGSPGRVLVGGSALARAVHGSDEDGGGGFVEVDLPAPDGGCRRTRVWDTGDLGMFHPGGELEILGRCDSGLKIRGSWVEPGDIEDALEQHPLVLRACVTAETDSRGQTELVAYVVPGQVDLQAATLGSRLRDFAASRLSPQSVPGRFVPVGELPLLPSGKVDRRRLRLAEPASAVSPVEASSEPGDLQEQVLAAFREALDDPGIGLRDDFETSGGHSLRAIRLCGILHDATGRRVAVGDLYRHPTPLGLARFLEEQKGLLRAPKWCPPELDIGIPAARLQEPRIPPRTVLVTGATGFLGAALVETLLRGTSVKVVALVRAGDSRGARRRLEVALGQHGSAGLLRRNPDPGSQGITGDHGSAGPGPGGSGGGAEHLQKIQEDMPKAGSVTEGHGAFQSGQPKSRAGQASRESQTDGLQMISGDLGNPGSLTEGPGEFQGAQPESPPEATGPQTHAEHPQEIPGDARKSPHGPASPRKGAERLQAIPGDLAKPLMGLSPDAFAALAGRADAILHLAADLDVFASYGDLEPANVGGTREVLRLAFQAGAAVHCVSSSAVFPLGTSWPEDTFGLDAMRPLAADLETSGADGYSLSKFAAELLVWDAFERGLPVSVLRIPHLIGPSARNGDPRDRLTSAVRALATAGVFPEGDWAWQFAPVDAVCRELLSLLEAGPSRDRPARHLSLEPLRAAQVLDHLRSLGIEPDLLPAPALASALMAAARPQADRETPPDDPGYRAVCAAAQLVLQYGPHAALNLSDAQLLTTKPIPGDPADVFREGLGT